MSDFRIPIVRSPSDTYLEQELDWDDNIKLWTLSEREGGGGHEWFQGMTPSDKQLDTLFDFFRIKPGTLQRDVIAKLSPGELALIHANYDEPTSVYAVLHDDGSPLWHVFRWEQDLGRWAKYGRTRDFSWYRGKELVGDDISLLKSLRSGISDPLQSPK